MTDFWLQDSTVIAKSNERRSPEEAPRSVGANDIVAFKVITLAFRLFRVKSWV